MLNHPSICTVISEEDEGPLAHLQNIIVEEFQDMKSGFKIDFVRLCVRVCMHLCVHKAYMLDTSVHATILCSHIYRSNGHESIPEKVEGFISSFVLHMRLYLCRNYQRTHASTFHLRSWSYHPPQLFNSNLRYPKVRVSSEIFFRIFKKLLRNLEF